MRQTFHVHVLILFLLIFLAFTKAPARLITTKTGDVKRNEITNGGFLVEVEDGDFTNQLMGSEVCEIGDDECLKRSITAEAHLDYIYTQHHKP